MNKPSSFGDAEAKRILERAVEIDAQHPMDAKALREIALEAGISPAALEKALEEHAAPPVAVRSRPTLVQRLWQWRVLILGVVLFVAFLLMRTAERVVP
jgi:hypothetical protein